MHTVRTFFKIVFSILVLAAVTGGCSSSKSSGSCSYCQKPDTIIVSSGGGFSGFYNYYSITSTGVVRSWQHRSGTLGDTVFAEKHIPCDSLAFYFEFLNKIDFASIDYSSNGNMNYKVERRTSGASHSVYWGNSDPSAPREVVVFHKLLSQAASHWTAPATK